MRGLAAGIFWTATQALLALVVAYLIGGGVSLFDIVTALVLAMLGTAAFLAATHPGLWKKATAPVSVIPSAGGVREQKAQVSGTGSSYQAGRDLTINQGAAAAEEFRDAPHIVWGAVNPGFTLMAGPGPGSPELSVLCTVNRDLLPDPRSWARSSNPADRVVFEDFDVDDLIRANPGTFELKLRLRSPDPGDRTITWRIVYFDTAVERGYVTESSVPVSVMIEQRIARLTVGQPRAMDRTSPLIRHERYVAEYGAAKHARST